MQRRDLLIVLAATTAMGIPTTMAFAADQTMNVDVCIVGAGAGGISAGMAAVDAGFKTVILEKLGVIGGGGNYMEGTFAVGSCLQIRDNVGINPEKQFKRVMDFHHWRINGKNLNNWLKETAKTIDWMQEHGINFEGVHTAFIDGNRTWHMFEGGHGSSLIKTFSEKIKAKGGQILASTPAESLIIDKDGTVKGVIAKNEKGDRITINAKAVVISTGGFSCNPEMVKKYLPYAGYESAGSPGRTGDGIQMLQKAGAELVNMNVTMQAGLWLKDVPTGLQFGKDGLTGAKYVRLLAALFQPYLKVSPRGERFADETLPLEYISNACEEVGGEAFAVFDDDTRLEMINQGLPRGYFGMVAPGTKFNDFDKLFAEGVQKGFCYKASSLKELAKLTGMEYERLQKTVGRMNKMAEAKKDDEYYKDAQWLRKVAKGPFYAIKGSLRTYATVGGASVNEYFQPLTPEGKVIKGVYAIGQDAGGLYSDSYDMHIAEGTASSWAINGGRLAVEHMKTYMK